MDALRGLFEDLGFDDVATFIASGNVIFAAGGAEAALEKKVERHLHTSLGYEVVTFLRSCPALGRVAEYEPFPKVKAKAGDTLHIGFLRKAPAAAARRAVLDLANDGDRLAIEGRELYWLRRGPFAEASFNGAVLEKRLGGPTTLRNANTVRKLAAKYPVEGRAT
jgi:uncharacterized protein (DUF1697 family)